MDVGSGRARAGWVSAPKWTFVWAGAGAFAGALACGGSDVEPATGDTGSSGSSAATGDGTNGSTGSTVGNVDTSGGVDGSSTGTPPVVIDCTEACADLATDAGAAVCYACRCKAAMDGWLPSTAELQCSLADEIEIYTADVSGPETVLAPAAADATQCVNPSLLYDSCQPGSRLGQIQHDDVFFKWICRDPYEVDGQVVYADAGAIAYNAATGASCWWDDVDNVTGDDDWPSLDLMDGDADNLARHLETFYYTEGDSCTSCHDNDPYVYTPYLQSQAWPVLSPHALGPYSHVRLDGTLDATANVHLVSPEVQPCTMCHRLSAAGSCDFLAADSLGQNKDLYAYDPAVIEASDPQSPHWRLAYWMPGEPPEVPTYAQWLATFGAARDRIDECCANPGVSTASCEWAPIPDGG